MDQQKLSLTPGEYVVPASVAERRRALIVTVTPTIMSGTVVRWHLSEYAEEANEPLISASRDGVRVHGYLHAVPPEILTAATAAYETLKRDRNADLKHLATHRRRGVRGPLEPVAPPAEPEV